MVSAKVKVKVKCRRKCRQGEWEGKDCLIVRVRDLSLKEDADVWEEMAKVASQVHQSDWLCRQAVEVELTDVSTQADLIPGNAVRDIGFASRGVSSGGRVMPLERPQILRGRFPLGSSP